MRASGGTRAGRPQDRSSVVISLVLFVFTARWFMNYQKKRKELGFASGHESSAELNQTEGDRAPKRLTQNGAPVVGSRGEATLKSPPVPYLKLFVACLENPCDPIRNPSGFIALCVAENKLVLDLLAERLMQIGTATAAFSDSIVYCYNSFLGIPMAREAAAYFLATRFLMPNTTITPEIALEKVNPKHVALGSGCSALLNYLFFILGEAGDACLIPAPYYAAFENDMNVIAGVKPFGFQMANATAGPTERDLNLAFVEASSQGLSPKFILLSNPNNPLGVIYKPEIIRNVVKWARKRGMHVIIDEIYGLATFKKEDHGFQSVLQILDNDLGEDVHMVYALSKDFGASGLRVGIIYSQNIPFMDALANLSIFSGVSGPIQYVVSELLTDDVFVDRFLDESRRRLKNSYDICVAKLDEMVVPFVPAEAGMFIYIDLSSLLPEKTFEWEAKLANLLFQHGRIVLTPGESQRERTPGMFRICYAWVSPKVLLIAMERLSRILSKVRRMDWDDLDSRTLAGVI